MPKGQTYGNYERALAEAIVDEMVSRGATGGSGKSEATEETLIEIRDRLPYSDTPTTTSIPASTNSDTLLAANSNRKGATFYNDSAAMLYLKLGVGAAANSFTTKLLQDDYYELPAGYVGTVSGVWSEAVGNVYITELAEFSVEAV